MAHRAIAFLALILILAAGAAGQQHHFATMGGLNGTVRGADGKPVRDAHVDLRNLANGQITASGYTTYNGSFEFTNIPNGSYEVVVTNGLAQATERAQVAGMDAMVNVIMTGTEAGDTNAGDRATVSVAQMKVPEKAREAMKKADKALAKHDVEEARRQNAKALEIWPKFAQALTMRGLLKLDEGHAAEALPDLEQSVEVDNGYAMGQIVLGAAYNTLDRFDDAIRVLDRGVALSPASWQGYFELGRAYLGKADYATALRQLDKAGAIAPHEYGPLHLVRANIHLAQKNYAEAMGELESYLQVDPQGAESEKARKVLNQVRAFTASR